MLASGKQLSNGKIKELYLKASLTGPTLFYLLLFFSFLQMLLMFDAAQTGYETAV